MVLFCLMWFCLALWAAVRLRSAEGQVGLWLRVAPGPASPGRLVRGYRAGGPWPPGGRPFPLAARAGPAVRWAL
jgi:hypothetical protein